MKYYYERANRLNVNYNSLETYYTRDLINRFTSIASNGAITYPVPKSGILNQTENYLSSNRVRGQLNYINTWSNRHNVSAILGSEISEGVTESNSHTTYGYNKDNATYQNVNLVDYFPTNPSGGTAQIPSILSFGKYTDRYISYFSNAAYTYNDLYIFSISGRIDKSNLFGVNTNQKSVPLYSIGVGWNFSKEKFYHSNWLPYGKLRMTYGYNGNVNKSVTAFTTTTQISGSANPYSGLPFAIVTSPGNPELRWERIRMINWGLDFSTYNNVVSGSIEYFLKKGIDLFGDSPLPPSTGLSNFRGNTANIKGDGVDIVINTRNIDRQFKWNTNFLLSRAVDKVTKYDVNQTVNTYLLLGSGNAGTISPLVGKNLFSIYSYKWAGLSPSTGDPQGYLSKQASTDYANIIANTTMDSMVYNGAARPTVFGSIRNTISYKNISLSFNIIYKLNYYFRRSSIDYPSLFQAWIGHKDFENRWQNPGDEMHTNVPSLKYSPVDANRAFFYMYSETLVEKGDHIRLQDISISYDFDKALLKGIGFSGLQIYSNVNNLGILWRANHQHLDPDVYSQGSYSAYPNIRTFSIGVKANF